MATITTTPSSTTTLSVAADRLSFGEDGHAFVGVVLSGVELFDEACRDHTHGTESAALRCAKACRSAWKREWNACYTDAVIYG